MPKNGQLQQNPSKATPRKVHRRRAGCSKRSSPNSSTPAFSLVTGGCCGECPSPPPYSCQDVPCDRVGPGTGLEPQAQERLNAWHRDSSKPPLARMLGRHFLKTSLSLVQHWRGRAPAKVLGRGTGLLGGAECLTGEISGCHADAFQSIRAAPHA